MRKVILLIALSAVLIIASNLAAEYGVAWYVRRPPPDLHTYWDTKSIKMKWELIQFGLLGLGVVSLAAAAGLYLQERKKTK